jgi:type I restriction enzyme R subunit
MESLATYAVDMSGLPSYLEKVQSQLPALHLLIQMGWKYLPPEECVRLRGGRLSAVILEPVLIDFIRAHGRFEFKGQTRSFTENAIQNAVQALRAFRATGATSQNEEVYDLLCLGKGVPQTVEGDTKSFNVNFIDWKTPENNTYHCTAEFKVERIGLQKHYIPDIVLFVNGIPLVVMENKRSAYTDAKKEPIDLAIQDLTDYQAKDGIPQLFLYSQILLALARDKAEYGTNGTPRKFWSIWREPGLDAEIRPLLSRPMAPVALEALVSAPFDSAAQDFIGMLTQGRAVYEQDTALYALCRPQRLLDLIYKFVLFDNGEKKIARYQQFFTVQDILARVRSLDPKPPTTNHLTPTTDLPPRPGGVVWHTQGSGKSLTMVMLAKCLYLASNHDPSMRNPKVILVTDRIDLDEQIAGTFLACGIKPEHAATGEDLVGLLLDDEAHVVTTLIHKFAAAVANRRLKKPDRNTFVLVDEAHRSNYNSRHAEMKLALKGACFIAFTGTPLAKKATKNTFIKFGDLFQPPYTIARAIDDKAVVPLLYEARHVPQPVDDTAIDSWFDKLTLGLSDSQRAELKRKFSSERQLSKAAQRVRMIAWDITRHYVSTYQTTGLKGQLVTPDKATALLYKKFFDEFGEVKTEVLISGPAVREGDDDAQSPSAEVETFWSAMMARYGSEDRYNKLLIGAFKSGEEPEIIIVVDKLLTGFDAPRNTVLYLGRKLKDHTLLQAIARVNRLFDGKEYGLILDYSGVIENLDEAIDFYQKLADYDRNDLAQTVTYIEDQTARLPQQHADVWELFASVKGNKDPEAYEELLRDVELRNRFYERFGLFARTLALALSSTTFLGKTTPKTVDRYKQDLKFFQNLRAAVSVRYQERVNYSEYEPKIRKLLDAHVGAGEVQQLCEPINLFDPAEREKVLEEQGKSTKSKADQIAAATQRVIEQELEKDPAFYHKFSKLIEDVLEAMHQKRLEALEALARLKDIAVKVTTHTEDDTPSQLSGQDLARRFYGSIRETLGSYTVKLEPLATVALEVVKRISKHKIRDWRDNNDAKNRMRDEIDDILYTVAAEFHLEIPIEVHDKIIDDCIQVAIANED